MGSHVECLEQLGLRMLAIIVVVIVKSDSVRPTFYFRELPLWLSPPSEKSSWKKSFGEQFSCSLAGSPEPSSGLGGLCRDGQGSSASIS